MLLHEAGVDELLELFHGAAGVLEVQFVEAARIRVRILGLHRNALGMDDAQLDPQADRGERQTADAPVVGHLVVDDEPHLPCSFRGSVDLAGGRIDVFHVEAAPQVVDEDHLTAAGRFRAHGLHRQPGVDDALCEVGAVVDRFGDGVDPAPFLDIFLLGPGVHAGAACLEHAGRGLGDLLGLADEVDEQVGCGLLRDERLLFRFPHDSFPSLLEVRFAARAGPAE
nr:MAG TPA: hypothetical protein [Caudoviricetes sp.]